MGLFDNLDPVEGLSSSSMFADVPEAPGMLRKGLEQGKAAVVGGAGGALALGARVFGAKSLEEKGLEIARRAEEEAAPYAFDVRDVSSIKEAAGVIPYALGALAPFIGVRVVGGAAGALLGRLVSGTTTGRNVGAVAGTLGVSAGLSAGSIFPEALDNKVDDPVMRSIVGGAASGLLDQVAPAAVLRRAGLLGKAAGGSPGGVKGAVAGAVKGFFAEGATEVAQEAIERGAGGQTVTGDEATGAYINAGVIGGLGGGLLGGGAGVFKTRPTTVVDQPDLVDPLRPSVPSVTAPEEPTQERSAVAPVAPAAAPTLGTPLPTLDVPEGNFGDTPAPVDEDRPLPTIGAPQPNYKAPVTPAPTIAEETTARLGLPRIFSDPRIAPFVDTTARAKLVTADAQFQAAPERSVREFLEPQLTGAREAVLALESEAARPAKERGRKKQDIARELAVAKTRAEGLDRAVKTLRALEASRGPEKTGSVALGQELNLAPAAPPSQLDVSPLELSTLQAAAREAPAFDRTAREVAVFQGNVVEPVVETPGVTPELVVPEPSRARSRIVYDAEIRAQEEAARAIEEASRPKPVQGVDLTGQPPAQPNLAGAEQLAAQAEAVRVDGLRARQAAGELLSTDEVRAVRLADKEQGVEPVGPGVAVSRGYSSSRGTLKQGTQEQKKEAFLNNATRAVDASLDELVAAGVLKAPARKRVETAAKRVFEEALAEADPDAARQTIEKGLSAALKGKVKKVDADTFKQRVLDALAAPQEFLSKAALDGLKANATDILTRHVANGGSTTEVATGKDLAGTKNYAVSAHKDRELVIQGALTEAALSKYIADNADLLSQPGKTLGTWLNPDDGNTYLDVSQVTPDRAEAMRVARENNQIAIFDLSSFETIPTESAPKVVRFTHWGNVPGGVTDPKKLGTGVRGRDWEAALEFGTLYTSAVVEGTNFHEPAVQVRTKYSGELSVDKVFDATNYRQDPRWAAAQEKVRAQYGPDFGAAMAQFQKDIVAEGYDAILFANGQLRIFAPVKVTRADANSRTSTDPADIARQVDAEYEAKGLEAIAQLERMLGAPSDLEVRLFVQRQEGGFAGRYRTTPLKDMIELAYNAKDILSLAAHEGFHRIETKHLGHAERTVIRKGLAKNSALYKQLIAKAQAYDAANGTQIAEEIDAIPQEAHAYGFEFWKRGELKVDGALERVFQKIRQLLERVRNYIDGLGFRSIEDVYRAIDMGAYAKRDGPLTAKNVAKLYDAIDGLESRADVDVSVTEALFGLVPRDAVKKVLAWADAGGSTTWGDIQALVSEVQLTAQQRAALEDRVGKDERALSVIEARKESGRFDAAAKRQQLYDSSLVANALFSELLKRRKVTPFGPSAPGRTSLGSAMANLREVTDRVRQQNEEAKKPRLELVPPPDMLSKAAWTPDRVDSLLRTYGLSSSPTRGQAYAVMMRPDQFLKLTSSARDQRVIENQSTPLDPEQLRNEFQEIYLDVQPNADGSFSVTSHEGRHRMVALRDAGIENVPVVLNMKSFNRREMTRIEQAKLVRQEGAQSDTEAVDLQPITYANKPALLSMAPGARVQFSKAAITAASKMPGRPYWVKRPTDVIAMRQRLEKLAFEGQHGRNWHSESAGAILAWAGYDVRRAATMAALISNFSPRTPVGLDLKKALAMMAKWEGAKVSVGAPQQHIESALAILRRDGEFDEMGNPHPGGIKRQNFFRNLMLGIDPDHYSADEQGSTIDMWVAHAFGYANDAAGSVNKSEYLFADREVKLLARELGWQVEETQAAIWVAIKARGNAARSLAQKTARNNGWYVPADDKLIALEEDLLGEFETSKDGKKVKYVIAPEKQRDYVNMWMGYALQFTPSYDQYQKANYNYADAFRDIREGVIKMPEGVEVYGMKDATQDIEGKAPPLQLFSKASLDQVSRRVQAGELEHTQLMAQVAQALDDSKLPDPTYKALTGAVASAAGGSLKRGYLKHFSSGMNAAKNSKGFANVFSVLTAYTQRKNRLIADGVESKLSRWIPASSADAEAAGRALMERTVGGFAVGSPEWQSIVDRLTPEQRGLFDQATAMVADRLRLELEADKRTMTRALGADSPAYAEWLENRTTQVERLIREGYIPERRYGDHTVTITAPTTDAAGGVKNITVFHEQYESEAEAKIMTQRYLDALSSVAPDLKVSQGFRYSPDHDASLSYQQFLDMARRFGIQVSQFEKERLAKAMISADSVRRNRIFRRKNVPGYSDDALRVLSEFGVTMANKVAYSEFSEPLGEAQKGTQVEIGWEKGAPTMTPVAGTNLWAEDGPSSGFYRNLSDETVDYVMTPQRDSEWSRKARAAASLHFLGGSLAAGMVQLSSLPMVSAPYLSGHTGYLNAVGKLGSAFKTTVTNTGVLTNLSKLENTDNRINGVDEVPGLRNALIQAAQDGTTLDTEIYQIMGMSRGAMLAKSRNVRRAIETWMLPFRKTEQWNRAATFIAAYNIGLENKLGGADLYKFAQEAVYNTQFRYDEANRPAIARNPIWAVMFTFKSYPIFMMETMVALAREKPQAAVIMLLSLSAAAGIEGLPFAEDLMDLIDTIAQRIFGSPFNSQRALRNVAKSASEAIVGADLSGVFVHGLVNELTGLSFASRVGLGNMIPGTRLGTADADYKRVADELIGPAAGMVGGWAGGAGELLKGNFAEAFSAAAPTGLKNLGKGWNQWDKGYATDAGGRKLVDVGGIGAIMQGIGFAPAAVTHAYELDRIDKRSVSFFNMVRDDFSKEFVKAIKDSNFARVGDLTKALYDWNTTHPDLPIAISATNLRRRITEAGLPINERTLKQLPKALRGGSEALGVTVGPGE